MNSEDPIRQVLIVGGGTAGWLSALYLNRFLRYGNALITLVEPTDLAPAGVGESTLPSLPGLLHNLRLDEVAFMRGCSATYKLAVRHTGWHGPDTGYWHPLGVCGGLIDGVELFHPWLRARRAGTESHEYTDFSMQVAACEALKAPRPLTGSSPIIQTRGYAFHLDAAALAAYLRQLAVSEGVVHLFDDVGEVRLGDDGAISGIRTSSGRDLGADLYIDCTAPRGRLIEDALADPWVDWSDRLLCDRAVLAPLPRDPSLAPYTEVNALSAGWRWRIPLSHRVGTGYIYSSAATDNDAAAAEMLSQEPPQQTLGAVPRFLGFRAGRRTGFWVKNCVAVGDAAGVLEPLGSTGIALIQLVLETLMEHFPDRGFDPVLARDFNRSLERAFDTTRDYVLLHYILSRRDDSDFWREARAVDLPDSLAEALERYDATGAVLRDHTPIEPGDWRQLLTGSARLPRRPSPHVSRIDPDQAQSILARILDQQRALVDSLPSHRTLVQSIHERTW